MREAWANWSTEVADDLARVVPVEDPSFDERTWSYALANLHHIKGALIDLDRLGGGL